MTWKMRSAVKNVLGYEDSRLTVVPEELLLQSETAVYSYPRAAASYEKGDITMDGKVDTDDVLMGLKIYCLYAIFNTGETEQTSLEEIGEMSGLTMEQIMLGNVDGIDCELGYKSTGDPESPYEFWIKRPVPVDLHDCVLILHMAASQNIGLETTYEEIMDSINASLYAGMRSYADSL